MLYTNALLNINITYKAESCHKTVLLSKHEKELNIAFSERCILTRVMKRWIFAEPTKEG